MGDSDLTIVAIALILAMTYGTFLYMYSNAGTTTFDPGGSLNSTNYNTPDAGNFFTQIEQIKSLNVNNPEIFFLNSIVFGTIAFLIVFIILRFMRGI